jgi:hypothetical protein
MRLVIPGLKLVSEANRGTSQGWRLRHERSVEQKQAVVAAVIDAGHAIRTEHSTRTVRRKGKSPKTTRVTKYRLGNPPALPLVVIIVRRGGRTLDSDSATSSGKYVRDQVAELLGFDDRDDRCSWFVVQRKAEEHSTEIRIVPRCPGCGVCRLTLPGVCALAELSAETPS